MNLQVGIALIGAGAVVMALSLLRYRSVQGALPFVDEGTRNWLQRLIVAHGALIVFFLAGYVVTGLAFARDWELIGETFVGLIFAFGAVFVYVGLSIQARMVGELIRTLGRLVPMCAECRRVRVPHGDAADDDAWHPVELEFGPVDDSIFTHSICPTCAATLYETTPHPAQ